MAQAQQDPFADVRTGRFVQREGEAGDPFAEVRTGRFDDAGLWQRTKELLMTPLVNVAEPAAYAGKFWAERTPDVSPLGFHLPTFVEGSIADVGGKVLEPLTAPLNAALLFSGAALPATASRLIAAGFSATQAYESARLFKEGYETGNKEKYQDAVIALGFSGLAAAGAAHPKGMSLAVRWRDHYRGKGLTDAQATKAADISAAKGLEPPLPAKVAEAGMEAGRAGEMRFQPKPYEEAARLPRRRERVPLSVIPQEARYQDVTGRQREIERAATVDRRRVQPETGELNVPRSPGVLERVAESEAPRIMRAQEAARTEVPSTPPRQLPKPEQVSGEWFTAPTEIPRPLGRSDVTPIPRKGAPRSRGVAVRATRKNPGSPSFDLHSTINPRVLTDAYTKYIGEPLWRAGAEQFSKLVGRTGLGPWLITRYGQPAEYVTLARGRLRDIEKGVERGKELGDVLSRGLSQADQQTLGRFVRGEASLAEVSRYSSNPRWYEAVEGAKQARATLDTLGGEAMTHGLLTNETFFKNYGKYMPRLYRKYEISYEALIKEFRERIPTREDRSRFLNRKDIPEEVRVLMGEIKEPAYPVAKGVAQITHDLATREFFQRVADNPAWTMPERMAAAALESGNTIPGYVQFRPGARARFRKPKPGEAQRYSDALGPLSGRWVKKEIFDDINQIVRAKSEASKIGRALVSEWKFGKVVTNPATHFRNVYSNIILNQLGGLYPIRVDIYGRALWELRHKKGQAYMEAKESGLLGTTFAEKELGLLLDSWSATPAGSLLERMQGLTEKVRHGRPSEKVEAVRLSKTRPGQALAKLYQSEEQWFKLAKFMHNREKGMSVKDAANDAQKWLFDYSEVPKLVEWSRSHPLGSPFITFTWKALPVVLESFVTHPWRGLMILESFNLAQQYSESKLGLTEEQKKEIDLVAPDWIKGNVLGAPRQILLPFRDENGDLVWLDFTYILPWGDIGETGGGVTKDIPVAGQIASHMPGAGSPLLILFADWLANKNTFTGQPIYKESDLPMDKSKKMMAYIYEQLAPPLAPGARGYERLRRIGEKNRYGEEYKAAPAIGSSLLGLRTTPMNVGRQRSFLQSEARNQLRELYGEAYSIGSDEGLTPEEKAEAMEKLRERFRRLGKKYGLSE